MLPKIYIIANSYNEAYDWARREGYRKEQVVFLPNVETSRGIQHDSTVYDICYSYDRWRYELIRSLGKRGIPIITASF